MYENQAISIFGVKLTMWNQITLYFERQISRFKLLFGTEIVQMQTTRERSVMELEAIAGIAEARRIVQTSPKTGNWLANSTTSRAERWASHTQELKTRMDDIDCPEDGPSLTIRNPEGPKPSPLSEEADLPDD